MILIAESGSTKTHWCLIESNASQSIINTEGINPLILSATEIETIILPAAKSIKQRKISAIHFFGAGCSTPKAIDKIKNQLKALFDCKNIQVDTDLKAACLALAGNKPGIIGLLGTGSNSCFWNGHEIEYKVPSLGYILGDEGGGVSIGKQLISDFIKHQMPEHLLKAFYEKYKLSTEMIIEQIYNGLKPNRFLAGFAPFIEENYGTKYCQDLIFTQIESFFTSNILKYTDFENHDIYFCGSIAYYHKDILTILSNKYNLNFKSVIKEPIGELIKYYTNI